MIATSDVPTGTLILLWHISYPFKPSFVCSKLFSFSPGTSAADGVTMAFDVRKSLLFHFKGAGKQILYRGHSSKRLASELAPGESVLSHCNDSAQKPSCLQVHRPESLFPRGGVNRAECHNSKKIFILTYFLRQKDRNSGLQRHLGVLDASLPQSPCTLYWLVQKGLCFFCLVRWCVDFCLKRRK